MSDNAGDGESVKRRTPVGTQPPVSATEPATEVSGVILIEPRPLHVAERAARSIIVDADDDWLDRLDLPAD